MGGYGKHPHDSGRARFARFRDQLQQEIDDLQISEYFAEDIDPRDFTIRRVPVRYGSLPRSSALSDSALAGALLDSGVFDEPDEIIPLDAQLGDPLLELLESERYVQPDAPPPASAPSTPPPVIRPGRLTAAPNTPSTAAQRMTMRGFIQGFVLGTLVAGAGLVLLKLLI